MMCFEPNTFCALDMNAAALTLDSESEEHLQTTENKESESEPEHFLFL